MIKNGAGQRDIFNKLFEDKKNKFIDLKIAGKENSVMIVIYEEIDKVEPPIESIKQFIIETVHEEVKSIRDIYLSFADLKK